MGLRLTVDLKANEHERVKVHGRRTVSVILVASALVACRGKLVATAPLQGPGTAEVKFRPTGKSLVLWADTDMKWKGGKSSKPEVTYDIEVRQGGKRLSSVACSTTDRPGTSICGSSSNIFGTHDADCEIALSCKLPPLSTTDEVELHVVARTGANVVSAKKMSLNVRED